MITSIFVNRYGVTSQELYGRSDSVLFLVFHLSLRPDIDHFAKTRRVFMREGNGLLEPGLPHRESKNLEAEKVIDLFSVVGRRPIENKLKNPPFLFQRFTAYFHAPLLVGRAGLEPTTLCLKGRYSTS